METVRVPRGLDKVGFHVSGSGGAPQPIVTGPRGYRIESSGDQAVQRGDGYHVTRFEQGTDTFVVVEKPRAGTWTFDAGSGPAVAGVDVLRPIPEPRVLGTVTGRGDTRRLSYDADLAPGDRLHFVESGKLVGRYLGGRRMDEGRHSIQFRTGNDSPGKRVVTAVVERRGLPYKRFKLDRYRAPKIEPLASPKTVNARRQPDRIVVNWDRVAKARSYTVVVRLGDGRVLRYVDLNRGPFMVPDVPPYVGADVQVLSVGAGGRLSSPGTGGLDARQVKRARVDL